MGVRLVLLSVEGVVLRSRRGLAAAHATGCEAGVPAGRRQRRPQRRLVSRGCVSIECRRGVGFESVLSPGLGGAAPWSRCSAASSSSLVHFSVRLRVRFATRDTITTVNQTARLRSIITTSVARRPGRAARRLRRPPHLYISASGAGFGCSSPSFVVRLQVQARRSSFVLGFVLGFVLKLLIISTKAQSVIGRQ